MVDPCEIALAVFHRVGYNQTPPSMCQKPQILEILTNQLKRNSTKEEASTSLHDLIGNDQAVQFLANLLALPPPCDLVLETKKTGQKQKSQPWTPFEDNRLLAGMAQSVGYSCFWNRVSQFVGNGRNCSSCSQRWERFLNPTISYEAWSIAEDILLLDAVKKFGNNWTEIARLFDSRRTDVQCRYHWRMLCNQALVEEKPKLK